MSSVTNKSTFTCIIPFYNESAKSVVKNVKEVLKVKEIGSFILIDDGSKSVATYSILKMLFINRKNILIKRLENNFGKTFAIHHALNYAPDGNIFLCDSDLKNLDNEEISNAIIKFDLLDLDMLILRRIKISFLPKIIRSDTLLSGERILRKTDLKNIIQSSVKGYELEVAINQYFINNNLEKGCFWSPSSAVNNYKYKKGKFFKGILKDLKMYFNLIKYIGFGNYKNQVSNFCKDNA
jgi:glycosyltransferase involved in cell wall biosynthesis